jgi:hypothetical protein
MLRRTSLLRTKRKSPRRFAGGLFEQLEARYMLNADGWEGLQLTNNDYDDSLPQVSGSSVVWYGYDGNDYEIFLYDGSTVRQLTDNDIWDFEPQVSGSNVVWWGGTP